MKPEQEKQDELEAKWREEFSEFYSNYSKELGRSEIEKPNKLECYIAARKKSQEEQLIKNEKALEALEWMRDWAFGTSEMEPQVTYVPAMNKFQNKYLEIKQALEAR